MRALLVRENEHNSVGLDWSETMLDQDRITRKNQNNDDDDDDDDDDDNNNRTKNKQDG